MRLSGTIFVLMLLPAAGRAVAQSAAVRSDSSTAVLRHSQDRWLSKDKVDHVTASAFLTGAQYYVLRGELEQSHEQSLRFAIAGTLALGVAKEIYDGVSNKGTPSVKDVMADVLGIALATVMLRR